ncbi:MAG TPA: N-acetyltransferase, partial [Acidimicrobiia bacterium]
MPPDFAVPTEASFGDVRLVPLGPEHNAADYAAWTSSIDHIRSTPGFPDGSWPAPMSISENLRDLERHADDLRLRRGFTYTVL